MTTKEQIKNTGSTFTPKGLADFLACRLSSYIVSTCHTVLDPACGEGELLIAMGEKLSESDVNFTLSGYDTNLKYLSIAKERMHSFGKGRSELLNYDFLQTIKITPHQGTLDLFPVVESSLNGSFDIIIANPPYVRTQILGSEQAQMLAKKFGL